MRWCVRRATRELLYPCLINELFYRPSVKIENNKLLCMLKGIISDAIYEKLYELYAKKCKQKVLALSECTFALQRVLKKMSSIVPSTRDANIHPYLEYLTQCMASLGPVVMHYVIQHGLDILYRPQLPPSWHTPTSIDPCTPPLSVFSKVSLSIPVPQGSANTRS